MKNSQITEAFAEINRLHPTLQEIYLRSSDSFSSFKTLSLKREFPLNIPESPKHGILTEMSSIWYTSTTDNVYTLHLYNYITSSQESISGFSAPVSFVTLMTPIEGIFSKSIKYVMCVFTTCDLILYAIERDTNTIINTEFRHKLPSTVSVISVGSSKSLGSTTETTSMNRLFVGCVDGDVYEITYKAISLLNYRSMSVISPHNILTRTIHSLLRKKSDSIRSMTSSDQYVIGLSSRIDIYGLNPSIKRIKTLETNTKYVAVQIVESSPLLFYCVQQDGSRDFYTLEGKIFTRGSINSSKSTGSISRDSKGNSSIVDPLRVFSTDSKCVMLSPSNSISFLSFYNFNQDQLVNFKTDSPPENHEQINVDQNILQILLTSNTELYNSELYILSGSRLRIYDIYSYKQLILNCRTEEIYTLYKNYGDLYFTIKYYELLSQNELVYRIEPFCKNLNIKRFGLYCYIAEIFKGVWNKRLSKIFKEGREEFIDLNNSIKKIKNIREKLYSGNNKGANAKPEHNANGTYGDSVETFMDELIQSFNYCGILNDHNISHEESLNTLLCKDISTFKKTTVEKIIEYYSKNRSMDSFIKKMTNLCPIYLSVDKIKIQSGISMLKSGIDSNKPSLMEKSLEYFKNMDSLMMKKVVDMFIEGKYYRGAVAVMRECSGNNFNSSTVDTSQFAPGSSFNISPPGNFSSLKYDDLSNIMIKSVRCTGSITEALNDSRESFLFPFFEGLLQNYNDLTKCNCCNIYVGKYNILNITNPLFETFLRDNNSQILWKHQLTRGRRNDAIKTLIEMAHRMDLDMPTKRGFLETALSISVGGSSSGVAVSGSTTDSSAIPENLFTNSTDNLLVTLNSKDIRRLLDVLSVQEAMCERKCVFINRILTTDSLLNDYLYNEYDLSIILLDILNYKDKKVISELYRNFIVRTREIEVIYELLGKIRNKTQTVRYFIGVLIDKEVSNNNTGNSTLKRLSKLGYEYNELISSVKNMIMDSSHPKNKQYLLKELQEFAKENDYREIKETVSQIYGI